MQYIYIYNMIYIYIYTYIYIYMYLSISLCLSLSLSLYIYIYIMQRRILQIFNIQEADLNHEQGNYQKKINKINKMKQK